MGIFRKKALLFIREQMGIRTNGETWPPEVCGEPKWGNREQPVFGSLTEVRFEREVRFELTDGSTFWTCSQETVVLHYVREQMRLVT